MMTPRSRGSRGWRGRLASVAVATVCAFRMPTPRVSQDVSYAVRAKERPWRGHRAGIALLVAEAALPSSPTDAGRSLQRGRSSGPLRSRRERTMFCGPSPTPPHPHEGGVTRRDEARAPPVHLHAGPHRGGDRRQSYAHAPRVADAHAATWPRALKGSDQVDRRASAML
ncbi:hypothetical protein CAUPRSCDRAFT_10885 [Caulochytrium protostelioides]|uniref:Uncharacterized protein n=1 Tax=Caulochytrium protostelioides TaxID=1555241 RepID=A0A4P9WYK2_9FUNG|nr:hypothetical protein CAUPRSCDRAFT_10885 [Caulochytrium protostelioides]